MNERSFTSEPSSSFLRNMRESPQKIQALGMHNRLLSYGGVRRKMGGGKAFCLHTAAKPAFQPDRKGRADIAPPLSKSKIFPERHSPPIRLKKFDGLPAFPLPKPLKREECGIWKLSFSRGKRQVWDAICKKIERLTGKRLLAGKRTSAAPCPFPAPILHLPPPAKIKFALPCAGLLGIISQKNSACPRPRATKS